MGLEKELKALEEEEEEAGAEEVGKPNGSVEANALLAGADAAGEAQGSEPQEEPKGSAEEVVEGAEDAKGSDDPTGLEKGSANELNTLVGAAG